MDFHGAISDVFGLFTDNLHQSVGFESHKGVQRIQVGNTTGEFAVVLFDFFAL